MTDHKPTNRNGVARNWHTMRQEAQAIRRAWRHERAEQPGWTHAYMQRCRLIVEHGRVLSATLIGIAIPTLAIALGVAVLI